MRFPEFMRTTVLLMAAAATLLGATTLAGANGTNNDLVVPISAGWWLVTSLTGAWIGRRATTSAAIASLLAGARTQSSLPELHPARTMLNRLWPLVLLTVGAGAISFLLPQVPGIAAGGPILCALAWRRQASAVTAIEERDGARFYIERTSPLAPIKLVRTPGFRSNLMEMNGASRPTTQRSA
jgi:hypothetical protein